MIMGYVRLFVREVVSVLQGSSGPSTPLGKVGFASSSAATGIGGEFGASQILPNYDLELFSAQLSGQSCVALR